MIWNKGQCPDIALEWETWQRIKDEESKATNPAGDRVLLQSVPGSSQVVEKRPTVPCTLQ